MVEEDVRPHLEVVPSPGPDELSYPITFIKSAHRDKYYAKLTNIGQLKLPYWNTFQYVRLGSFRELADQMTKLEDRPLIAQILGAPQTSVVKGTKVRRTIKNFAFTEPGLASDSPIVIEYPYVVLDIDKDMFDHTEELELDPKVENKLRAFRRKFIESYEEYGTTEDYIRTYAYGLVAVAFKAFPYKGPLFVRLSSSFGKGDSPFFRGHIYVPLSQYVAVDEIASTLYSIPFVDHSPYFNPTQPIFTARPINYAPGNSMEIRHTDGDVQILDGARTPLQDFELLRRCYYWEGNKTPLDGDLLRRGTSSITTRSFSNRHETGTVLPATELSGKRGAFNRVAQAHEEFSIRTWLLSRGYIECGRQENIEKYLSPYSKSGSPGTVLFPDGYLIEFHEESPIKDILKDRPSISRKYSRGVFSAYDLWFLESVELDNPNRFKIKVDQALELDPTYQRAWQTRIENMTTFIAPGVSAQECDDMIDGILEEMFFMGLKADKRNRIYELISTRVKELAIKEYRLPVSKLQKKFSQIARDYAAELQTIHPANTDIQNAVALIESSQIFKVGEGDTYVAEHPRGDMLTLISNERKLEDYVRMMLPLKSNAPLEWNHSKMSSTARTVPLAVKSRFDNDLQPALKMKESSMLFKSVGPLEPRKAVDILTGEVKAPMLNEFILHQLPFTEKEYKTQRGLSFGDTHWGKFLSTSFANYEANIDRIRDLMAFIMLPQRASQYMVAFIGLTRSGKTLIKNTIVKLLGTSYATEMMFSNISDRYSMANMTNLTRLLVLNEFNTGLIPARKMPDTMNLLKAISGADPIVVRRMHTDPIEIRPKVLPLLISNETPKIHDKALLARLFAIRFRRSFAETVHQNPNFDADIFKELPYIFEWIRTNPRIKGNTIPLKDDSNPQTRIDFDETAGEADPKGSFLRQYFERADETNRVIAKEMRGAYQLWRELKDEKELESWEELALQDIRRVYPDVVRVKKRTNQEGRAHPILQLPSMINNVQDNVWHYKNIKWKDKKKLIEYINQFDSPEENEDD